MSARSEEILRRLRNHLVELPAIEEELRPLQRLDSIGTVLDSQTIRAAYAKKHAWDDEWVRLRIEWLEDATRA